MGCRNSTIRSGGGSGGTNGVGYDTHASVKSTAKRGELSQGTTRLVRAALRVRRATNIPNDRAAAAASRPGRRATLKELLTADAAAKAEVARRPLRGEKCRVREYTFEWERLRVSPSSLAGSGVALVESGSGGSCEEEEEAPDEQTSERGLQQQATATELWVAATTAVEQGEGTSAVVVGGGGGGAASGGHAAPRRGSDVGSAAAGAAAVAAPRGGGILHRTRSLQSLRSSRAGSNNDLHSLGAGNGCGGGEEDGPTAAAQEALLLLTWSNRARHFRYVGREINMAAPEAGAIIQPTLRRTSLASPRGSPATLLGSSTTSFSGLPRRHRTVGFAEPDNDPTRGAAAAPTA